MSNKDLLENIKKLRELTGVGFKDCKVALDESKGDIEKSIIFLRKKGIAKASKKMSRTASEGLVLVKEEKGKISIIEILIGYSIFLLALEYLTIRQVNKNRIMKINSMFWISLVCVSLVFFPEITVLSVGMALIGISYPYLITRNSLIRIIATVFFGLLHGFGFASNLSNFDSQSLVSSIILFNLGIEAAQILYAFFLLLALNLIAKTRLISRLLLKDFISLIVFFFSTLWFIGRLLF